MVPQNSGGSDPCDGFQLIQICTVIQNRLSHKTHWLVVGRGESSSSQTVQGQSGYITICSGEYLEVIGKYFLPNPTVKASPVGPT